MKVIYTPYFKKSFKKLNKHLQKKAWKKLEIFKKNHFNPKLKTHKLQSSNYYSFSVTHKIRVIFLKNKVITLVNIGDHSLYRKI